MDLTITLIQANLEWENIAANLALFDQKLATISSTNIVVLPEMFTTGFSMNVEVVAETMNGTAVAWMHQKAKQLNAVITGSLIIKENDKYYNRLLWVEPDGKQLIYDKKHRQKRIRKEQKFFFRRNFKSIIQKLTTITQL